MFLSAPLFSSASYHLSGFLAKALSPYFDTDFDPAGIVHSDLVKRTGTRIFESISLPESSAGEVRWVGVHGPS